jgi:2-polyprenyl-3-methyl-5-hydroxy-6-metoxy-1,4-benzoquinol methylase
MNIIDLKEKIARLSQFPHKERSEPYQSYYLEGEGYISGSRDTLYRFERMELPTDFTGKTVLDLGCQLGAMSIEAYRRGARDILGIENEIDFLDCAIELAKYNNMPITYKQANLSSMGTTSNIIKGHFAAPVDIVLALSLTKHVGVEILRILLNHFAWKVCYIEGHNCNGDLNTPHCQDIRANLVNKFNNTFIGFTEDRNTRPVWKLEQFRKSG